MKFAKDFFILASIPGIVGSLVDGHGRRRRLEDVMPQEAIQEFKKNNILNQDFNPVVHEVTETSDGTVEIDHEMIPLAMNQLHPIDVFTPNVTYMFEGKVQDAPPALSVYTSDVDPMVMVSMNSEGSLQGLMKLNPATGEQTSVVPIGTNSTIFVEVTPQDVDQEELGKYEYADPETAPDNSNNNRLLRRHQRQTTSELDQSGGQHNNERNLQGCRSFRVIELAVAYDSTFCNDVGGTEQAANDAIQRIVAGASQIYQQPGLCLRVAISAIDGFCSRQNDPYTSIVNLDVGAMAGRFRNIINDDSRRRSFSRDVFHLFFGGRPGLRSVGYAYLDVLCSSDYAFGVDEATYSTNPALQVNLLAHELGHNAGSSHDSQNGQNVMSPVICDCPTFSASSVRQINEHVNTVQCLTESNGPTPPLPAPTPPAPRPTFARPRPTPPAPRPTFSRPRPTPPAPRPTFFRPRPTPPAPAPTFRPPTCVCPTNPGAPRPTQPAPRPTRRPNRRRRRPAAPNMIPTPVPPGGNDADLVMSATFDDSAEGFTFVPNPFFGVDRNAASYTSGAFDPNAGETSDGALTINLGGVDGTRIYGVSGGWSKDFVLDRSGNGNQIELSVAFQLEVGGENDYGDYALAVCAIDGQLYGTNRRYYMANINGDGDGGPPIVGPYTMVQITVPTTLNSGSHTLQVGAYLQSKDSPNEYAQMRIDSVELAYI